MSQDAGLPRVTMLISAVAIVFAGIAAFVLMKWTDANSAAKEAQLLIEELAADEEAVRAELDIRENRLTELEGRSNVLISGKLSICNLSSKPVTVALVAATYLNSFGEFETFNSESQGRDLWRIGPGERQHLDYSQGATIWDGSVSYYSVWLSSDGEDYPYAGTWPADDGFCVRWTGA